MALPAAQKDAIAVVTGASSGIGVELARLLAQRGHPLLLVARREDRLEELAAELRRAHGVDVEVHAADLADEAGRAGLIAALERRTVAVLCNNAGYGSYGAFAAADQANERAMTVVNVTAVLELTGAVVPGMVERGAGAVLNVGSIAGNQPTVGMATYAASKAFVNSFSEALHAELKGTGVTCTLLTPGPVVTEFATVAGTGDLERELPGKVAVAEVARQAVEGMEKGRRVVVPGAIVKALAAGGRYAPRAILLPLSRRFGGRA
jgi:short-subunit dehydrogenase